ncbi:MAG: hypothetical protein ACI4RP_07985 [Acutalibacteraceae bacterium]
MASITKRGDSYRIKVSLRQSADIMLYFNQYFTMLTGLSLLQAILRTAKK